MADEPKSECGWTKKALEELKSRVEEQIEGHERAIDKLKQDLAALDRELGTIPVTK